MSKRFKVSTVVSDAEGLAHLCNTLGVSGLRFTKRPRRPDDGNRRPYDGVFAHHIVLDAIKTAGKPLDVTAIRRAMKLRGFNPTGASGAINRAKDRGWIVSDGKAKYGHFSLTDLGQAMVLRWSPGQQGEGQ